MHWPDPTTEEPTPETIAAWADQGGSRATDGCWLEQATEACEHGYPSWLVVLGYEAPLSGD